jgi:hypothetical protein
MRNRNTGCLNTREPRQRRSSRELLFCPPFSSFPPVPRLDSLEPRRICKFSTTFAIDCPNFLGCLSS